MAHRRSCGSTIVTLARSGNCAAAVRAFHKAKLYTRCSDARIGTVRKAIHACLAKGNPSFRDGVPAAAPAPAASKPAAPAAAAVAGWWPFSKKTKKLPRDPRRMAQTVMYIPSPSGRVNQVMRGAKRRRR